MTISRSERHNKLVVEFCSRIQNEIEDPIDRLVLLESIIVAIVGTLIPPNAPEEYSKTALKILFDTVERRLLEVLKQINLGKMQ